VTTLIIGFMAKTSLIGRDVLPGERVEASG
jgi:hypothetical protein